MNISKSIFFQQGLGKESSYCKKIDSKFENDRQRQVLIMIIFRAGLALPKFAIFISSFLLLNILVYSASECSEGQLANDAAVL